MSISSCDSSVHLQYDWVQIIWNRNVLFSTLLPSLSLFGAGAKTNVNCRNQIQPFELHRKSRKNWTLNSEKRKNNLIVSYVFRFLTLRAYQTVLLFIRHRCEIAGVCVCVCVLYPKYIPNMRWIDSFSCSLVAWKKAIQTSENQLSPLPFIVRLNHWIQSSKRTKRERESKWARGGKKWRRKT